MFYSSLLEEHITDVEYQRAPEVWNAFKCKSFKDYHDAYILTDVLLLVDIFKHFRSMCLQNYGLDPVRFYTSPGLSFQACLKMTGVKLDLFADPQTLVY